MRETAKPDKWIGSGPFENGVFQFKRSQSVVGSPFPYFGDKMMDVCVLCFRTNEWNRLLAIKLWHLVNQSSNLNHKRVRSSSLRSMLLAKIHIYEISFAFHRVCVTDESVCCENWNWKSQRERFVCLQKPKQKYAVWIGKVWRGERRTCIIRHLKPTQKWYNHMWHRKTTTSRSSNSSRQSLCAPFSLHTILSFFSQGCVRCACVRMQTVSRVYSVSMGRLCVRVSIRVIVYMNAMHIWLAQGIHVYTCFMRFDI